MLQVEIEWDKKPYLNVITNNTLGDLYEKNATQVGVVFDEANSQVKHAGILENSIRFFFSKR